MSLTVVRRSLLPALLVLSLSAAPPSAQPQSPVALPDTGTTRSPHQWAVLACESEIDIVNHEIPYLRYRTHVVDAHGERSRIVVESRDGSVARTVLRDGKALSPEDEAAERKHLEGLAASPSEFERHQKNERSNKKIAVDLIRLMPDAMIYTPVSNTADLRSPDGNRLVIFDYKPNPRWTPPSTTAEALTGLQGRLWLDGRTGHVVRIDGEVFRPVNMGWGMLARIYPGGKLSLEQRDVGGGRWIYTHFSETAKVRALMFKTIDLNTEITATGFEQLPGSLSYQQAIALLLQSPAN